MQHPASIPPLDDEAVKLLVGASCRVRMRYGKKHRTGRITAIRYVASNREDAVVMFEPSANCAKHFECRLSEIIWSGRVTTEPLVLGLKRAQYLSALARSP
jgi:uncharacterized membrane protein